MIQYAAGVGGATAWRVLVGRKVPNPSSYPILADTALDVTGKSEFFAFNPDTTATGNGFGHARHSNRINIATLSGGAVAMDPKALPTSAPVVKFNGYYLNEKYVAVPYL